MSQPQMPRDQGLAIPVLSQQGANTTLKISPSGSSTQSGALSCRVIRIVATATMNIEFGANPTASATTSLYLPANTVEYFSFIPGNLVAAIGTGDVYITPMS